MVGLLLDTNAMVWFLAEEPMEDVALFAIADAQAHNALFVSPITAWKASLALSKPAARRPNLIGKDAATWFREGRRDMGARLVPVGLQIALEAARVPGVFGSGDPGDCYIIATARRRGLQVVTRDRPMMKLAGRLPGYLSVLAC